MAFVVTGTTTDAVTTAAIASCDVYLWRFGAGLPTCEDSAVSDGAGAFSLDAPDGDSIYSVAAYDPTGAPVMTGLSARDITPDEVLGAFPDNTSGASEYFFFYG